jgi:hypothetical protein
MPDYDATAELHMHQMRPVRFGEKLKPGPLYLRSGNIVTFVNEVMSKREPDAHLYSITVPLEAGFGKDTLYYREIEEISQRADFPRV